MTESNPINTVPKSNISNSRELDGTNWSSWKKCMLNTFALQGLDKVVLRGFVLVQDVDNAGNITYPAQTRDDRTNDIYAQNLILNNVISSIGSLIDHCDNSCEMWRMLNERYEGTSQMRRTNIIGLEQEFNNLRMIEGESVDKIWAKINVLKTRYATQNAPLTDDRIIARLLQAMPRSWESLRVALGTAVASQDLTPEELVSQFRNFEIRLKQLDEEYGISTPLLDPKP